jgi:hypothetical protein
MRTHFFFRVTCTAQALLQKILYGYSGRIYYRQGKWKEVLELYQRTANYSKLVDIYEKLALRSKDAQEAVVFLH